MPDALESGAGKFPTRRAEGRRISSAASADNDSGRILFILINYFNCVWRRQRQRQRRRILCVGGDERGR